MTTNLLNLEEKLLRYNYIISKEVLNIISSQQSKKKKKKPEVFTALIGQIMMFFRDLWGVRPKQ